MPIKLPKGFIRRKSSGNLLDTARENQPQQQQQPQPQPSFRVLERKSNIPEGFGGGDKLRTQTPDRSSGSSQGNLFTRFDEGETVVINRGIGHTYQPVSTAHHSSDARDGYSTEPSSVESSPHEDLTNARRSAYFAVAQETSTNTFTEIPAPRPSLVTKLGERSFNFAFKGRKGNAVAQRAAEEPMRSGLSRERSMSASSYASTTIPPVLNVATDVSEFQGGFRDTLQKRHSSFLENSFPSPVPGQMMRSSVSDSQILSNVPPPVPRKNNIPSPDLDTLNRSASVHASLYSWETRDDREQFRRAPSDPNLRLNHERVDEEDNISIEAEDENSRLVMDALYASQALGLEHSSPEPQTNFVGRAKANIQSTGADAVCNMSRSPVANLEPFYQSPKPPTPSNHSEISSQNAMPRAVTRHQALPPSTYNKPPSRRMSHSPFGQLTKNKRMTVAEFERYRREVTQSRHMDAEDDDEAAYEEDDEADRIKQIAKQRQKQEANMAVYRQQMMRLTGERTNEPLTTAIRPMLGRASQSTPDLLGADLSKTLDRFSALGGGFDDGDDDEDIPLGVLQAHGFPNQNRPPAKGDYGSSTSLPRMASYPAPSGSTRNDPTAGGGGLPAFAKHLTTDPYVGASLVRPTDRESMHYSNAAMPSGGLVGVIAGEERARAMRRGTPISTGSYGPIANQAEPVSQHVHRHIMPLQAGMPVSQLHQHTLTPTEQAHLQMSNSMSQMVELQKQWMQQMFQMQHLSQLNPQQPQSSMQSPFLPLQQPLDNRYSQPLDPYNRPYSVASSSGDGYQRPTQATYNGLPIPQVITPQSAQPTLSARSSYFPHQLTSSYTPSIAPSERSNVGQPSRYRPVTTPNSSGSGSGGSSMTPPIKVTPPRSSILMRATTEPFLSAPQSSNLNLEITPSAPVSVDKPAYVKDTIKPVAITTNTASDDEEDEAGWRELQQKREERKEKWRLSRTPSAAFLQIVQQEGRGGEGGGHPGGGVEAALLFSAQQAGR